MRSVDDATLPVDVSITPCGVAPKDHTHGAFTQRARHSRSVRSSAVALLSGSPSVSFGHSTGPFFIASETKLLLLKIRLRLQRYREARS